MVWGGGEGETRRDCRWVDTPSRTGRGHQRKGMTHRATRTIEISAGENKRMRPAGDYGHGARGSGRGPGPEGITGEGPKCTQRLCTSFLVGRGGGGNRYEAHCAPDCSDGGCILSTAPPRPLSPLTGRTNAHTNIQARTKTHLATTGAQFHRVFLSYFSLSLVFMTLRQRMNLT